MVELSTYNRFQKSFFNSSKRNEINEMKILLSKLPPDNSNMNREKRREVFKKLIAYLNMGIDLSSIFQDVILASITTDVIQKNLISIYLQFYAKDNDNMALLLVNTYLKEAKHKDKKIRALAIKSLSFMPTTLINYTENAILEALYDDSSYVRRMALLALFKLPLTKLRLHEIKKILEYNKKNLSLIIPVLMSITYLDEEYTMAKKLLVSLFNNIKLLSLHEKSIFYALFSTYIPKEYSELEGIQNTLCQNFDDTNLGMYLSRVFCYLSISRNYALAYHHYNAYKTQIYNYIEMQKINILLFVEFETSEHKYVILKFFHRLLLHFVKFNIRAIFENDYSLFVPTYLDLTTNAVIKIDILKELTTTENVEHIVDSIMYYCKLYHQSEKMVISILDYYIYVINLKESLSAKIKAHLIELIKWETTKNINHYITTLCKLKLNSLDYSSLYVNPKTFSTYTEKGFESLLYLITNNLTWGAKYCKTITKLILTNYLTNSTCTCTVIFKLCCHLFLWMQSSNSLIELVLNTLTQINECIDDFDLNFAQNFLIFQRLLKSRNHKIVKDFCINTINDVNYTISYPEKHIKFHELYCISYSDKLSHFIPIYKEYNREYFSIII